MIRSFSISIFFITFWLCSFSDFVLAATFTVFNASQLQTALTTAASNGEDDSIYLAPQRFSVNEELTYYTSENHSLTLSGLGKMFGSSSRTVLDGNLKGRILNIETGGLSGTDRDVLIWMKNITFKNGKPPGGGIGGGLVVKCDYGSLIIEKCVFEKNASEAHYGGALLTSYYGGIYVANSVFLKNKAGTLYGGYGGALALQTISGEMLFANNAVVGNSTPAAGSGVAVTIYNASARVLLANNIIYDNTNSVPGYKDLRVNCTSLSPPTFQLKNNLFTEDTSSSLEIINCGTYVKELNIFEPPKLTEDFHLQKSSPCIDKGVHGIFEMTVDMDGDPRPLDGTGNNVAETDIGPDEYIYAGFPWDLFLPKAVKN